MRPGCVSEVTFVLGGARSGKSRFAQRIASRHRSVVFIATATACDPEMEQRIKRHRQSRPLQWRTLEVPLDLDVAILSLQNEHQLAIIDCLTLYLANVMSYAQSHAPRIEEYTNRLCAALQTAHLPMVVVSNEVGSGVHAATRSGRLYCDLLGELNQRVAAIAQNVIVMMAGIPVPIKGQLPVDAQPDIRFDSAVLQREV
jgi:adenosylcobinamide kinase / adenosylcobinamide-phosphate guanylyltransferase